MLALTGSQGKTGTKDYLAQVLAGAGPTVATAGNHNNELGVPLTVLRCTAETDVPRRRDGRPRDRPHRLPLRDRAAATWPPCSTSAPPTSASSARREAIARAKGEIVEALPADGTAVLNADDDLVAAMATRTDARGPHLRRRPATSLAATSSSTTSAARRSSSGTPGSGTPVRCTQSGAHQVENAAAAAAMALAVGVAARPRRRAP